MAKDIRYQDKHTRQWPKISEQTKVLKHNKEA